MANYNPYAAPQPPPPMPPHGGAPAGPPGATQYWEIGEVYSRAWELFKPNWVTLVFTIFLGSFVGQLPGVVVNFIKQSAQLAPDDPAAISLTGVGTLIGVLIGQFFQVGYIRIWVGAARGGTPQFGEMFQGGSRFLPLLGGSLLVGLAVVAGYIALIVPGIIVGLGLCLTQFYIVDQGLSPIDAIKASWRDTSGQKGKLFLFFLVGGALMIAGYLACCVGVLVAIPVFSLAFTIVYLRISGRGDAMPPAPTYGGGGYGGYGGSPGFTPPTGYGPPPPGGFGGR